MLVDITNAEQLFQPIEKALDARIVNDDVLTYEDAVKAGWPPNLTFDDLINAAAKTFEYPAKAVWIVHPEVSEYVDRLIRADQRRKKLRRQNKKRRI